MIIAAGEFKAKCLKLMDKVNRDHEEIIISKRGKPVAKLIPIEKKPSQTIFGLLKDAVSNAKDSVEPINEVWNVEE